MTPQEIVNTVLDATGAEMMSLQLLEGNKLKLVGTYGFDQAFCDFFDIVTMDDPTSCGAAFDTKTQIFVADVEISPVFAGSTALDALRAAGVRSCISTPLISRDDELLGMISIHRREVWSITSAELREITALCQQISVRLAAAQLGAI